MQGTMREIHRGNWLGEARSLRPVVTPGLVQDAGIVTSPNFQDCLVRHFVRAVSEL